MPIDMELRESEVYVNHAFSSFPVPDHRTGMLRSGEKATGSEFCADVKHLSN